MKWRYKLNITLFIIISFLIMQGCNNERGRISNNESSISKKDSLEISDDKIEKVYFYIENSASMFGYVANTTQYVDVLTDLAQKPIFAKEHTIREFNFINGGKMRKLLLSETILQC